jgi:hypothetical protein
MGRATPPCPRGHSCACMQGGASQGSRAQPQSTTRHAAAVAATGHQVGRRTLPSSLVSDSNGYIHQRCCSGACTTSGAAPATAAAVAEQERLSLLPHHPVASHPLRQGGPRASSCPSGANQIIFQPPSNNAAGQRLQLYNGKFELQSCCSTLPAHAALACMTNEGPLTLISCKSLTQSGTSRCCDLKHHLFNAGKL